ncbi:glycosyltransferase [Spirosoma montaniterrae]|uniref:Glycosyl transferase family 1 n=1 Tax=Spirosoma montaniterrae TaxID=1178516 RepID=A0A1P9X255_9BACT|nr:glycosyltransferase [Spirosoma montaniterrae]AQG81678.1 glycosyl transferase family 1 [Spirosoma montaniterrae]
MIRILHVSTAHPASDPRIAYRVLPTLAPHYELIALLPNGSAGEWTGIRYVSLFWFRRVWQRVLVNYPLVLWHTLRLRPALFHIYDPELLPLARFVQLLLQIPVIYEVHENLYKKLDAKASNQTRLATWAFCRADRMAQRHFYLIFTEHGYTDTYRHLNRPSVVIHNYPTLPFFEPFRTNYATDPQAPVFFYIGWISLERAFDTLLLALASLKANYPNFRVHLFGDCAIPNHVLTRLPGFAKVCDNLIFYGYTNQQTAFRYAAGATAGLALLNPVGDYPESYTTKLFEYMALGLPVVTSDFPLYREVVERHGCGFCVSPNDPVAIADALLYFIQNEQVARDMGQRGRQAVETMYNWETESKQFLSFYRQVLP